MSLLSIDITRVKRLSLRDIKLPPPERRVDPITPILVERPPSDEEIVYSKLVAINPLVEELVERLSLVSITTGERIKKVKLREDIIPQPEPQDIDIIALVNRIIEGENNYTQEEIKERIKKATNVNQDRADIVFNLFLQAGQIKKALENTYYLTSSTPF
jgi:hypothetical protein